VPGLPATYGPLAAELQRLAAADRRPISAAFELTSRCNLACRMCYVRRPAACAEARSSELSTEQWLDLAQAALDNGMLFLLLTGGEPLLRPDFFEIYTPLTQMGLLLTLFTNGTLITERVADLLAGAPPSRTEITLYGASAEVYEAVTGVPGSYARCCAGIEALTARGVPLGLKTTLTRQNVGELGAMREMAHAWGLPLSAGWLLSKRRDGADSEVEKCRLSFAACRELEAANLAPVTELIEAGLLGADAPSAADVPSFHCYAGKASFVISSVGEMSPCIDLIKPAARPLEVGFAAAWQEVQDFVDAAPPLDPVCSSCDARAFCPRCPSWSARETGTLSEPVPYLCELAFARRDLYAGWDHV